MMVLYSLIVVLLAVMSIVVFEGLLFLFLSSIDGETKTADNAQTLFGKQIPLQGLA
jgi:hypothetical protein